MPQDEVIIYTDGSCSGNPGPGGWACILLHSRTGISKELSGGAPNTTNNRMEMTAVIEALKALKRPVSATVYSDSSYIINAFQQNWLSGWQRRGWQKADKSPVLNSDLWQELLQAAAPHQVNWQHVPGHQGVVYNERCDALARAQTEEQKQHRHFPSEGQGDSRQ